MYFQYILKTRNKESVMKFLNTEWKNLIMANYEVDKALLETYVPAGCELDLFKGKALVSVVAFEFSKTRICGVPMPFYRNFPEINLRIYVKRNVDGVTRRGVVFIKEIIAHKLPAWIANMVFRENFHVMPVSCNVDGQRIKYRWGEGNQLAANLNNELESWKEGSEEKFIGDNFWAYKKVNSNKTLEFEVIHRQWKMRKLENSKLEASIDFADLYGAEFGAAIADFGDKPTSVFFVDGSEVEVTVPRKLKTI